MAMTTHQLVGLSLQVGGEGEKIHESDSFTHLKQREAKDIN